MSEHDRYDEADQERHDSHELLEELLAEDAEDDVDGPREVRVCERCGSNEHVHRGLCRRCREALLGPSTPVRERRAPRPQEPDVEPLHRPPWRRKGA